MSPEIEAQLTAKYPDLLKDIYQENTPMFFGITCGDGWYTTIDTMLQQLDDLNDPNLYLTQAKEKFGALRVYIATSVDIRERAIAICNTAETASQSICEDCGSPAKNKQVKGWLKTVCNSCLKKYDRD